MAIGYARVEFVKRSAGKNACGKAAYNSRSEIEFKGTELAKPRIYDWSHKPKPAYHEILLPDHVDAKFKDPEVLWNAVETKETKANAQVQIEVVLALPDDKIVTLEDKIAMTRSFVKKYNIENGLCAQVDIHAPEPIFIITRDNEELGLKKGMKGEALINTKDNIVLEQTSGEQVSFNPQEFTGFIEKEHNWHAHVLLTTRRFKENGLEFEDHKARDLMPRINKGKVISGPDWGKLWAEHQNSYFEERGWELRVDPNGLVPQEHLGPYRMRGRAFSLFEEQERRIEANRVASRDPEEIIAAITERRSVFTKDDLGRFLLKHVPAPEIDTILKEFWQQPTLVQLVDKETGELLPKYTSQKVIEEEQQILRLADRIATKPTFKVSSKQVEASLKNLNPEQQKAFQGIIQGNKLALIHGYAGTGKSYLLKELQETYESAGYRIRALGPDNATADVLREKGLPHTENVFRFLYALRGEKRQVLKGKEVWILDEAGKLGNQPLLEFLKEAERRDVKIVLSGDSAQLPPVDRGGMFKVLCEKYRAHVLEDIQRQKVDTHREIAKSLATGNFGAALDKLGGSKGIRWTGDKREAIEELVLRWASDTKSYPQSSALIIAHSNNEVRVLNEMVRIIRKQRGELGEKEYQCTTSQGSIYISVGDRIEFRRNDKELGVSNGLSGTLIEASPTEFVVAIKSENKKHQTITFNPQEFHAFQLGYASTFYRSQGRTVDRAYVLHSSMMNKEMFYVGLTRHVKDVLYFVSKEEVYCLADLKRLAVRTSSKSLTVEYTTAQEIQAQQDDEKRTQHIENLKQSDSLLTKAKGYGLEAWDQLVAKAADVKERIQDRTPDRSFYKPRLPNQQDDFYPVLEVKPVSLDEKEVQTQSTQLLPNEFISGPKAKKWEERFASRLLEKLSPEQLPAAKAYLSQVEKATALKQVVEAEVEATSRDIQFAAHFQEWQEACGTRNQAAYELVKQVQPQDRNKIFGPKTLTIIQDQANKYEAFLSKKDRTSQVSLEDQLKDHIELLLYRLFPDGPTSKTSTNFRFGNKGSLSVAHSGSKMGQFYDFEQKEGGSLLKLVQRELGFGQVEAKAWAQDFLGNAADISIPKTFTRPMSKSKEEDTWISLKPDPAIPAPKLEELKGKYLSFYYNEVQRHAYKDENGQLLYYVLRLRDKNDLGKKITPPLSYGYWKSQPDKVGWELKGYQAEKHSLYNLNLLKENPRSTVLVVEGEKTADLALNKQIGESYICVTWPGGASAVDRADWEPLRGRKVIIWPDNDQAGYDAADQVCTELKRVGVESLHLVNKEELKRYFPEKWDLADPLPKGVAEHLPQKLIASALDKAINPEQILLRLSINPKDPLLKARANEILWRVDERLRPELEKKHGIQFWKTHDEILKEAVRIVSDLDKKKGELKEVAEIDGKALERLSFQVGVFEAERGRKPRTSEISSLKLVITEHGYVQTPKTGEKGTSEITVDKMLMEMCSRAIRGIPVSKVASVKSQQAITQTINEVQQQMRQDLAIQSTQQKEFGKEKGSSIRI